MESDTRLGRSLDNCLLGSFFGCGHNLINLFIFNVCELRRSGLKMINKYDDSLKLAGHLVVIAVTPNRFILQVDLVWLQICIVLAVQLSIRL